MRKTLLTLVVALGAILGLEAQRPSIRLEAGANFNSTNISLNEIKGATFSPENVTGLRAGLAVEIPIGVAMYIAPGVTYRMAGSEFGILGSKIKVDRHYVAVPVNLGFRASLGGVIGLSIEAGPTFSYGLSSNSKVSGIASQWLSGDFNGMDISDVEFELDDDPLSRAILGEGDLFSKDVLKRFETGLNISAALELRRLYLRVGYEMGLSNASKLSKIDIKDKALYLGLGIRL